MTFVQYIRMLCLGRFILVESVLQRKGAKSGYNFLKRSENYFVLLHKFKFSCWTMQKSTFLPLVKISVLLLLWTVQKSWALIVDQGIFSHLTVQISEDVVQPTQCQPFFERIEVGFKSFIPQ